MQKKSSRVEFVVTPSLEARIFNQLAITGENKSEFVRRCLLEKLEHLEEKQAEHQFVQQALEKGFHG